MKKFSGLLSVRSTLGRIGIVATLVATAMAVLPSAPAAAAVSVAAGFSVQSISTPLGGDGSYKLTDIKYVSPASGVAGGLFAAGKDGTIAWIGDDGAKRTLGKVPNVRQTGDNGLVGITPAHDYATSRRVYVVYNRTGTSHHYGMLAAWRVNSVANPTSVTWERHLIDGSLGSWIDDGPNHQVGDVLAWPDGSLFVSQGDGVEPATANATALWSQDVNDPHGKIFHILPNGQGAPDNPFYDSSNPSSWKSRVYATGVRNGFRLWRDSSNGKLFSSIVGWDTNEVVAEIRKGGNYGWPCWEGNVRAPGYSSMTKCQQLYTSTSPSPMLWVYPHNGLQASVTGGVKYTGSSYPTQYKNKMFVGDFARQEMWTFGTDGTTLTSAPTRFGTGIGNVTAVRACQDGDICWTDIVNSKIMRLRYGLANRAPLADATATVNSATRTVAFDGSASSDPEGDPLTYAWKFGDGTTGTGQKVSHTYSGNGPYTADLTVTDGVGNTGEFSLQVFPGNSAPTIDLTKPAQANFAVGDVINLSASVSDREDGTLPASGIQWRVEMAHCPFSGPCHPHPSGEGTGATFQATFPDHGGQTSLIFTATSPADSNGVKSEVKYTAAPRMRTLTVAAPSGVTATISGDVTNTSSVVAKANVSVSVPTTSSSGAFQRWSDGVTTAARQIVMPDSDLTMTPLYGSATSPLDQRYIAMGGSSSWLGAPTGAEFSVAGGLQRNYQWGSLYWSTGTGVHWVKGGIRTKYQQLGGPTSYGFPKTDEVTTADGIGRYNDFSGDRSIYWTPTTNAHEVHGGIRKAWVAAGKESGRLGYPTSDEYLISIGRRSDFQHGYITWNKTTGVTQTFYT